MSLAGYSGERPRLITISSSGRGTRRKKKKVAVQLENKEDSAQETLVKLVRHGRQDAQEPRSTMG